MNDFEQLLSGFIDDSLSDVEQRRLAELIQSDPEYRARYLEHCALDAALAWEHGVLGEAEIPRPIKGSEHDTAATLVHWWRPLAWAAGLVLVLGLLWNGIAPSLRESQWQATTAFGTVSVKAGGQLSIENLNIALVGGDELRAGDYVLVGGYAQLDFDNGARVLVEAPARFRIDTPLKMALHQGRLSAEVSPEATGFKVETPGADVIDYGTEFGVEVDAEQRSEVHVFSGEVEVVSRDSLQEPVRLLTDQATRVDAVSGEPSGIEVAPERFMRSLDEPMRTYGQEVRDLDPVVYYRMSISDNGETLIDRSGNGIDGRIVKGKLKQSIFAAGRVGAALRMNGVSGKAFARVNDYPKATNGQISVVAWVFAESRPRWASIAKNWGKKELGQFHFGLFHDQGGLEVQIREADGGTVYLNEGQPLPLHEWQHVAFVADGDTLRLFRNGEEVAQAPHEGLAIPEIKALGIGRKLPVLNGRSEGSPGFWDGRIDELSIFNRALSPEQIKKIYDATLTTDKLVSS